MRWFTQRVLPSSRQPEDPAVARVTTTLPSVTIGGRSPPTTRARSTAACRPDRTRARPFVGADHHERRVGAGPADSGLPALARHTVRPVADRAGPACRPALPHRSRPAARRDRPDRDLPTLVCQWIVAVALAASSGSDRACWPGPSGQPVEIGRGQRPRRHPARIELHPEITARARGPRRSGASVARSFGGAPGAAGAAGAAAPRGRGVAASASSFTCT